MTIAQEPHSGFKSCLYNLLAMLTLGLNFLICKIGLIYLLTKRKIKGMRGGADILARPSLHPQTGPPWVTCSSPIVCPTRLQSVPRGPKIR